MAPALSGLQGAVTGQMQGLADNAAQGIDDAMKKAEDAAAQASANIKRVFTTVLGAVSTYVGAGMLTKGLYAAGAAEQDRIAFETLLGSAEAAKEMFDDLTEFAAKTPFEMPEIKVAARGLVTFGERGDEMMKTLNILGNAAAGTSSNFGEIALIFNQVRGVGKLLTQDFRQLSTRGIISLQDIADYFGVTTAAAQDMLSKGKVSFDDLKKILAGFSGEGGKFYNLMERQSTSFLGVMSTLKDTINLTFAAIGEGIRPIAVKIIAATLPILDFIRQLATSTGPLMGNIVAMTTAVIGLTTSIMSARVAMQLMGLTFKQVLIGTGWGIALIALGVALGFAVTGIQKLWGWLMTLKPVQDAMSSAVTNLKVAWEMLSSTLSIIGSAMMAVFQSIVASIESTLGFSFAELPTTVSEAFIWIVQMLSQFVADAAAIIAAVAQNWQLTWDIIKTYIALKMVETANAMLVIWDTIKAAGMGAAYSIGEYWKTMGSNLVTLLAAEATVISSIYKSLWESIKAGVTGEGNIFESFAKKYDEGMAGISLDMEDPFDNAAKKLTSSFVENLGSDSPLADTMNGLKEDLSRMTGQLGEEAYKIQEGAYARVAATEATTAEQAAAAVAAEEAIPSTVNPTIEAGKYGLAQLGQKVQDVLMKKDEKDKQGQMVSLMEEGNKKQDELITAVKEQGAKPAVLT